MQSSTTLIDDDYTINYTYTANFVDCTNGNINLSFDKISDYYGNGTHFYIIKTDLSANTITLTPFLGDTINNASSYVMTTESIHLICYDTNWYIL
jgi:hypothetical protein